MCQAQRVLALNFPNGALQGYSLAEEEAFNVYIPLCGKDKLTDRQWMQIFCKSAV